MSSWLGTGDGWRQDVRYAWRSIARTPGFALLVVLAFTLGLGVNAATFTVLDTLFLKPPDGVARPSELRRIWRSYHGEDGQPFFGQALSGPQYRALAELAGPQAPRRSGSWRSPSRWSGSTAPSRTASASARTSSACASRSAPASATC